MAVRCSLVACILFPFYDFYLVDDLFSVFLMKRRRRVCHRHHHAALVSNPIPRRNPLRAASKILQRDDALQKIVEYHPVVVVLHSFSLSLCGAFVLEMCVVYQKKTNADWLFFSSLFNNEQRRRQRHQRPTTTALLLLLGGSCPSDEVIKMQRRRITTKTKTLKSEDNKL